MKTVAADAERALDSGAHRALEDVPGRILTVRELEKVYEGAGAVSWVASLGRLPREPKPALGGVSFAVSEGEILGVLGPKTSGKSTPALHRGLDPPERGPRHCPRRDPVDAQHGIVIRDDRSFNPASRAETTSGSRGLQGVPPEIDARIDDMLRRMALDRSADRPFASIPRRCGSASASLARSSAARCSSMSRRAASRLASATSSIAC